MRQTASTYYLRAALLLGCLFSFAACENDPGKVDEIFKKKIAVEEAIQVISFMSEQGKVKGKLTSPYMLRYQTDSPYIEFPRTLHVDFYDDSSRIESVLDAKYARYNVEFDRKILLRDSVRVMNLRTGDTLRTQELWWDQVTQEFYTDKPAHVSQRGKAYFARNGLRAAQNLSWYQFINASGNLGVPDETLGP